MEGGIADLSRYRLARASEMLEASEVNLEAGQYKTLLNRSYYAVFHAMCAVNALDGFEFISGKTTEGVNKKIFCGLYEKEAPAIRFIRVTGV